MPSCGSCEGLSEAPYSDFSIWCEPRPWSLLWSLYSPLPNTRLPPLDLKELGCWVCWYLNCLNLVSLWTQVNLCGVWPVPQHLVCIDQLSNKNEFLLNKALFHGLFWLVGPNSTNQGLRPMYIKVDRWWRQIKMSCCLNCQQGVCILSEPVYY